MISGLFRKLTAKEEKEFVAYAREHEPELSAWYVLHPVCRAEWIRLGKAPSGYTADQ